MWVYPVVSCDTRTILAGAPGCTHAVLGVQSGMLCRWPNIWAISKVLEIISKEKYNLNIVIVVPNTIFVYKTRDSFKISLFQI